MSRGLVSTEFYCRRISVIVNRSAGDKLTVHFTHLPCLGLSLIPVKERSRERVSGKVSNQRFVNSCLANSQSVWLGVNIGKFTQPRRRRQRVQQKRNRFRQAKRQLCSCTTIFGHFSVVVARLQRETA